MIIITGFGKENSLGAGIARALVSNGYKGKIVAVVNEDIPCDLVDDCNHVVIRTNLSLPSNWQYVISEVGKIGEPIDGLINAAGANYMDWIKNIKYQDYSNIMRINLDAPIFLTKEIDKIMSNGFVLNVCSMGARKPFRTSMPYNVSKAALVMATKQMARELYPESGNVIFGISPNQIAGSGMTNDNESEILKVRGWTKEQADSYRMSGMLVKEDTTLNQVSDFIAYLLKSRDNYIQFCGMEIQYGD